MIAGSASQDQLSICVPGKQFPASGIRTAGSCKHSKTYVHIPKGKPGSNCCEPNNEGWFCKEFSYGTGLYRHDTAYNGVFIQGLVNEAMHQPFPYTTNQTLKPPQYQMPTNFVDRLHRQGDSLRDRCAKPVMFAQLSNDLTVSHAHLVLSEM